MSSSFSEDMQKRLQEMLMKTHEEGMTDAFSAISDALNSLIQRNTPPDQIVATLKHLLSEKSMKKDASGKCPSSGCIKQDSSGKWRIISNKTGKDWPQHYESYEKASNALKAYHAASTLKVIRTAHQITKQAQSLSAIERKLEMMEARGLENTEEYRKLNEEADRLADRKNKLEEEFKVRDEARTKEQEELSAKERFEKKKEKVEQAWNRLEQEDWFKKVKKHYPIEQIAADTWRVKSLAADWDSENQPTWDFFNETDAKEKVLQLVNYRYYDYYLREGERGVVQRDPRDIASSCILKIRRAKYNVWKVSEHKGVPKKVDEIAHAIKRDQGSSPEAAHRMAWETYCSYTNPSYEGCTEKGKSKRKSPKSEY